MKRILTLTFILLVSFTGIYAQKNEGDKAYNYLRGKECLQNDNIKDAMGYFAKECETCPKNAYGFYGVGYCLATMQYYEDALSYIEKATQLFSKKDKWIGYKEQGFILYSMGKPEAAHAAYTAAIKAAPKNAACYKSRGECYFLENKFTMAKLDFHKAIELEPTNWENYSILGEISIYESDFDKAEEFFLQAVRFSPTSNEPFLYLSILEKEKKNYDTALDFLTYALQMDLNDNAAGVLGQLTTDTPSLVIQKLDAQAVKYPKVATWPFTKGLAYEVVHQYHKAAKCYDKAFSIASDQSVALYYEISALTNAGEYAQALEKMEQFNQQFPEYRDKTTFDKIGLLFYNRQNAEALTELDTALTTYADTRGILQFKAKVLRCIRQYEQAMETWQTLTTDYPKVSIAYFETGEYNLWKGDTAAAREWFQKALAVEDANRNYDAASKQSFEEWQHEAEYNDCGPRPYILSLFYLGETDRAEAELAKMEDLQEQEPNRMELARIHAVMGHTEKCIASLQKALEEGIFWDGGWIWPERDPDFDSVRALPAFQQLMQEFENQRSK